MNTPARSAVAAVKATLVGGISGTESLSAVAPIASTLRGISRSELTPIDVDATLFQDDATSGPAAAPGVRAAAATAAGGRTTVLPRSKKADDDAKLVAEQRPRFDRVRTLGEVQASSHPSFAPSCS